MASKTSATNGNAATTKLGRRRSLSADAASSVERQLAKLVVEHGFRNIEEAIESLRTKLQRTLV